MKRSHWTFEVRNCLCFSQRLRRFNKLLQLPNGYKMAWSKRFIPKLFVWHSSRDIVRMKWRYNRTGYKQKLCFSATLSIWDMRQQLCQFEILLFIQKSHTKYVVDPQLGHHWYKPTQLTAISSHCLAALPAKMSAFSGYMRQNAYRHRNLKRIFVDLLPCYCYATKANSRTIRSRLSQLASAGKEANLVNCKLITACYQNSEPGSCAVWVSYRQKTVIARINPTNRNWTDDFRFSRNFCFLIPISRGGQMPVLPPPLRTPLLNAVPCSIQFRLYSVSVLLSQCHEWSAGPISACLRRELRGCFRSEFCAGGESVAAPRVNCSLATIHRRWARGWTGHKYRFSSLRYVTKTMSGVTYKDKNLKQIISSHYRKLSIERNPFPAKNQTLKIIQSIYFAYEVGIISSYSNITLREMTDSMW